MSTVWLVTIPVLTAYLVGSLPLGAWLVRKASGFDPREVNAHLLGVENVYRLVGGWVAVGSFTLDVLKGLVGIATAAVAVALVRWGGGSLDSAAGGSWWAPAYAPGNLLGAGATGAPVVAVAAAAGLFGVLLGHLYPLRLGAHVAPRGRGNGVLLGGLTGLFMFGAAPFWLLALPVVLYAAILARTDFVALATVAGLAGLGVAAGGAAVAGLVVWPFAYVVVALVLMVGWRHK